MELVGYGNNDRFDLWIGQHLIVVQVGGAGLVDSSHPGYQVFRHVTDRVQFGIASPATGIKMGRLRDRPCSQYSYSQQSCFFLDHSLSYFYDYGYGSFFVKHDDRKGHCMS